MKDNQFVVLDVWKESDDIVGIELSDQYGIERKIIHINAVLNEVVKQVFL